MWEIYHSVTILKRAIKKNAEQNKLYVIDSLSEKNTLAGV